MSGVKQVRVLRNVLSLSVLCLLILWLMRSRLWEYRDALAFGSGAGLVYGLVRWRYVRRRIARRDRRYERNKIFVHYLNGLEVAVAALAHNLYLASPLSLVLVGATLLAFLSGHWWTVLGASFGLVGMGGLAGCILRYEQGHGPVYYQYKSDAWSGAEGLLYQAGTVVQPLQPAGKVKIGGVLWNAVALSGETIDLGERIEVISVERLTLYVDRLPDTADFQPS
jgi:membrane protein implicated in regulation of membrane protease activity